MDSAKLRIVSLIPSATEIVAALGYADCLVGRSHECDYPPTVSSLPICTEPKFDPVGTSGEIHQRVTDLLTSALSVYRVKTEVLAALRPTHIITQAQCEVCAVSLGDVEKAVSELVNTELVNTGPADQQPPIQIVSLEPNCLADVWTDIARVATALETPATANTGIENKATASANTENTAIANQVVIQLKKRLDEIKVGKVAKETLHEEASPNLVPPTVACIEWSDPLMAAGNWVPELVSIAGGSDCFGQPGQHSDWMSWDALLEADPDIIIVLPCGYDLSKARQATEEMAKHPDWPHLKAVKHQNVYITDGNQYFNRPGPRLVESGEILAEIIQKRPVNLERQSKGWENWQD